MSNNSKTVQDTLFFDAEYIIND